MDLTSKQETRFKWLAVVLIIAVTIFLFVIFNNYLIKGLPIDYQETSISKRINIDFDILRSPILKELQLFEEISLSEESESLDLNESEGLDSNESENEE